MAIVGKKINGFSLLELVISICIIGIAAALAISEFEVTRAKAAMTGSLADMSSHRNHISRYYSIYGNMPSSSVDYHANDFFSDTYGDSSRLQSDNGTLTTAVSFERFQENSDVIADLKLSLQPSLWESGYENPRVMLWNCGYNTPPAGAVSLGINHTNIPSNYLPSICQN